MIKSVLNNNIERLKNVLVEDKKKNPEKVLSIINSDVRNAIENYVELFDDGIKSDFFIDENGVNIIIKIKGQRMKEIGFLP
ncbi:MAG: hypothetical protein RR400_00785 [Clostridia bacterium]